MEFRYNCLSLHYKEPFGCIREHETCRMTVEVSEDIPVVRLSAVFEGEYGTGKRIAFKKGSTEDGFVTYSATFTLPCCDLYFYHFVINTGNELISWYRHGENGTAPEYGERWQITCYPADFTTPDAFSGAIMYQIFPDRFFKGKDCDLTGKLEPYVIHETWGEMPNFRPNEEGEVLNNDFFGGNLDGIIRKLDYLKSLNVEILYLTPICMAFSNHRYDTADYKRVDPMLGSDEDFAALCREAHKLGMKVILDGVYSHTGSNSVYFDRNGVFGNGAYQGKDSPYFSWYDFQEFPNKYTCWWDFYTLPCVNEMDEAFLDYIIRDEDSVIAHWLALGADGFRLDVADELPDDFIALFRARVKEINPEAIVLGEVWEDASNKVAYGVRRRYFSNAELDSIMNYPFRDAILAFMGNRDAHSFHRAVTNIVEHYPTPVLHCLMNALSTHDTPRLLTLLGDSFTGTKEEKSERYLSAGTRPWAVSREICAAVLQFTLPGMPSIFYGDEVGMEGFDDPLNRQCYPWGNEDAGLLEFYRTLTGFKANLPALRTGSIEFQSAPDGVIDYVRQLDGQCVHVIVNGSTEVVDPPITGEILYLHNGLKREEDILLKQWGTVILLEEALC